MVGTSLFQVTVYGGLVALVYMSQCLRKRDVHFALKQRQFGHAYAPIHDGTKVRVKCDEVANRFRHRRVVGHACGGPFRCPAPETVEFARLACSLVLGPSRLEESRKFSTENKHGSPVVTYREPLFDPNSDRIFV